MSKEKICIDEDGFYTNKYTHKRYESFDQYLKQSDLHKCFEVGNFKYTMFVFKVWNVNIYRLTCRNTGALVKEDYIKELESGAIHVETFNYTENPDHKPVDEKGAPLDVVQVMRDTTIYISKENNN